MSDSGPTSVHSPPAAAPRFRYNATLAGEIEQRWQERWEHEATFRAVNPGEESFDPKQPRFYCLDMFPYPSGAGLHVGHPLGYIATDIVSRYERHRGRNVLHPMGWDSFGLPAEQYAIETGVHPVTTTRRAIDNFRRQLKRFGFSYDWSRELATMDPRYYRWTQWIWLKAYHAWYDLTAGMARPIDDLIQALENGRIYVGPSGELVYGGLGGDIEALSGEPIGSRKWHELTEEERRDFIDRQRLAYLDEQTVNWCPKLGTVLANEEVINGRSERGGHPVHRKPLKQWMFRITAYAQRLLEDLDELYWPESTRSMQKEWIGRSEGAEIDFPLLDASGSENGSLRVFTTRPDTVFGATYMVIAPEHPLVDEILDDPHPQSDVAALRAYVDEACSRSDVDRMAETREKTGVFTGTYAINPATGERIPIWVADYVLMSYGHGAIMAVPGHDLRDWEFARRFSLPVRIVVQPPDRYEPTPQEAALAREENGRTMMPFAGEGVAVNSENDDISLDDLPTERAVQRITNWFKERGIGRRKVNYRLRDWLFSRQRYWGEPFPIVYDRHGRHYPIDEEHLPVTLPEMDDYHPVESHEPMPLLGKATEWVQTTAGAAGVSPDLLPPDEPVTRETNTMPGWAGSCWYYLRFCDPGNDRRFVSREAERYWLGTRGGDDDQGGVDLYIGGAEHAVLHLLYARFWHKILYDLGEVETPEPFQRLFHQGLLTSFAYQRPDKSLVATDEVEQRGENEYIEKATGEPVMQVTAKMSKSLRNVINPDDVIAAYGADTFRLYEMYMGPLESSKPWNMRDIVGVYRFLQRVWRLVVDEDSGELTLRDEPDEAIERHLQRAIAKVGDDIERLAFNTAIASMIEFINEAHKASGLTADQLQRFAVVLSPFAPHVAEELWAKLGHCASLSRVPWPSVEESLLREEQVELPVQIMGKVRGHITVRADADRAAIEAEALGDARITDLLEGREVRKVIVVPGKIVNIVV